MELYTLTPKEKRFRPLDKTSAKVDYTKTFYLKPDVPTEVPDDIAEILLFQNPNLVSKKPLGKAVKQTDPTPKEKEPETATTEQIAIITEISETNIADLELKVIREYGTKLGIKIPPTKKGDIQRQMLIDRINILLPE